MKQALAYALIALIPLGALALLAYHDLSLFSNPDSGNFFFIQKGYLTSDYSTADKLYNGSMAGMVILAIIILYLIRKPRRLELRGPIA